MAKKSSTSSRGSSARKKTTAKSNSQGAKAKAAVASNATDSVKAATSSATADAKAAVKDAKAVVETKPAEVSKPAVAETKPKAAPQPAASAAASKQENQSGNRRGGFFPLVLGGLIAGGIGYGAATYLPGLMNNGEDPVLAGLKSSADANSQSLTDLKAQVAELSARPQVPDLSGGLAELGGKIEQVQSDLTAATSGMSGLSDRIAMLEKRPMNDALSPEAVAAYESELAQLRSDVTAQSTEIQNVAATAKAELESVLAEASAMEVAAEETAKLGAAQAAAGRVQAEVAAGAPFASALMALVDAKNVEVPEVLTQSAEAGVSTVDALQKEFPDLARSALALARQIEGPAEGESGVASFFKSQLGVRSLEPQEGSSADAVLSRAEFAAKEGRLADAITEIDALPDDVKTVFDAWRGKADQRSAAIAAADALAASLAQN